MDRTIPTIWIQLAGPSVELWLDQAAPDGGTIRLDTVAWVRWLDASDTTRFAYPIYLPTRGYIAGFLTVRKERRQRGGSYWVAYRRITGQLRKAYLGRSAAVTRVRLQAVARQFQSPQPPERGAGTD